jgi:hypothetical protein
MPQTVPNKPIKGVTLPQVARKLIIFSSRLYFFIRSYEQRAVDQLQVFTIKSNSEAGDWTGSDEPVLGNRLEDGCRGLILISSGASLTSLEICCGGKFLRTGGRKYQLAFRLRAFENDNCPGEDGKNNQNQENKLNNNRGL